MKQVLILVSMMLTLAACSKGMTSATSSSDSGSGYKLKAASIAASDHGLLLTSGGASASSLSLHSKVSAQSSLSDSLLRVQADGSLSQVSFTVDVTNPDTGAVTTETRTVAISATKQLNDQYIALELSDNRVGVLNKATGDIYDITGVQISEMQIDGTNVYSLNASTGQLFRVDLTDASLTVHDINEVGGASSNTGFLTTISSLVGDSSSPLKFLGFNQIGSTNRWPSPSFMLLNDMVMAVAGPSGNTRPMLFQEGQAAYDCQFSEAFTVVGGGADGGVIQTADKSIYQIRLVTNAMASDAGDRLVKVPLSASGNCVGDVTDPANIVVDLGATSNFSADTSSYTAATNYSYSTVERYVLGQSGFLHTYDDGSGGVTMDWTALDFNLSGLPTDTDLSDNRDAGYTDNKMIVVEGGKVYFLNNNVIYSQDLQSGSSPQVYYTASEQILNFNIVSGQLFFTVPSGSYSVLSSGASATLIGSGVTVNSAVAF